MKSLRRIHSWLGVLFAPSILVFAVSGIFQMYGCHEGEDGSEPPGWIVRLAQIHMKQTVAEPRRRPPRPQTATPAAPKTEERAPTAERASEHPTTAPLRLYFLLMSLGLVTTSFLGLYLAFTSKRDQRLHVALLAAGIAIPIVLMLL